MTRASSPTPKRHPTTGRWYFVFDSIHPRPDGRRRQIKREGFETRAACKDALKLALDEDEALAPTDGKVLTVEVLLNRYYRAKRLAGRSDSTLNQITWASKRINACWGGWEARRVTTEQIEKLYADLLTSGFQVYKGPKTGVVSADKGWSPETLRHLHVVLKAALQLAVDRGDLLRNPARLVAVGTSRQNAAVARHWSPSEVGQFLDYAATQTKLPIGLPEVLADSGARRGEALALRWSDFDSKAETIAITRQFRVNNRTNEVSEAPPKRQRAKAIIALHPATVARLKARRAQQNNERLLMGGSWPTTGMSAGLIFTWPTGEFIHPSVVTRIVSRMSIAAGLPRLTPHGLRHSFATAALAERVPVEVVAARLGDTARVIQETYAHVLPADDAAAAKAVGDLFRRGPGSPS